MSVFGQPRRHFQECSSTNDLARLWATDAADPAPHAALVTADFQTQGRGRRGHAWDAKPSESALMSFVLRPAIAPEAVWQLGFVTALAAADGLQALGLPALLKWPNDILLGGCKAGGVLVEVTLPKAPNSAITAIAGIGLNVNQPSFDAAHYAYPPTSLRRERGREWNVAEVIESVAAAFTHWDAAYREEGFAPIFAAWQERLAVGAVVKRGAETGSLVGIALDGRARVRLANGTFTEWLALD